MTVAPSVPEIEKYLRSQLAEILYCHPSEIDDTTPFADLGLDSVLGVELITCVNPEFRVNVAVQELYRYATVAALAERVAWLMTPPARDTGVRAHE
ncbi:acyl carrier protein [Streptomyces sp. AK02-04a]|uniref:acyl carrier protein n=1 Tax=Streptomyces sp. AK02-04a TaxID=3028649 RepID=UPI0029BA72AD|nr:acyl carrier protein [Streptomyces sp. AK02-04a]MDX3763527.1 acyl carrier protein [Streptomyces sp. AK02-04a]